MNKISISLLPECGDNRHLYNYGRVMLTWKPLLKETNIAHYTIFIYNDALMLMGHTDAYGCHIGQEGCIVNAEISEGELWVPGKYFLLIRNDSDEVFRYDLILEPHGDFKITAARLCKTLSEEDVLSGACCMNVQYWQRLSMEPGLMQMKRWMVERARQQQLNQMMEAEHGSHLEFCSNLLVTKHSKGSVNPYAIGMKYVTQSIEQVQTGDCETFYDVSREIPYMELNSFFMQNMDVNDDVCKFGEVKGFFFYNIGILTGGCGKSIMKRIIKEVTAPNRCFCFYGTKSEIQKLMEQHSVLERYFPPANRIAEERYTETDFLHLIMGELYRHNLRFSPEAVERICEAIVSAYEKGALTGWDKVDVKKLIAWKLQPQYCKQVLEDMDTCRKLEECMYLQATDIRPETWFVPQQESCSAWNKLQEMVGLTSVKQALTTLSHQVTFWNRRREMGLPCSTEMCFHTLLTGNPGTGKTTVARLMGSIFHSLGILSRGDVICVDRKQLIGHYIGDTEENMRQILQDAKGNVLFVDEAYTLFRQDNDRDFGRNALECLLEILAEPHADIVIIFAGYEKEMKQMMEANPGLEGRFPNKFHFPDYDATQLLDMAKGIFSREQYELSPEAMVLLEKYIRQAVAVKNPRFSNGRWMEQLVRNGIIPAMAERLATQPQLLAPQSYQLILPADIEAAAKTYVSPTGNMPHRKAIGFCA